MPEGAIQRMKPLLMHRDRDFDPHNSLRRAMYGYPDAEPFHLSSHQQALIHDLELNILFQAMARDDNFLSEVAQRAILSGLENNTDTIRYRQAALKDCLNNREVVQKLYALTAEATVGTRTLQWTSSTYEYLTSLHYYAIDLLELLLPKLRSLRIIADESSESFTSEAFRAFFAMLREELGDEYLATIGMHLSELRFRKGILLSAALNEHNEGTNYTVRRRTGNELKWFDRLLGKTPPALLVYVAEGDVVGAEVLAEMRRQGIGKVALVLAESAEHVLRFFEMLRTELGFYLACSNLYDQLAGPGPAICFPEPAEAGQREYRFRGLRDLCLVLQTKQVVVANNANMTGKDLVLITGANQGGKSTFLRSLGVSQLMMQVGMFVAAEEFVAELCTAIFTHYKREEDASLERGKFDDELARLSRIADHVVPNAMVLFNESFAATNEREGSAIAEQIVSAFLEKRIKVIYVTHLFTFAHAMWEKRSEWAFFLRAERAPDGSRTFKMSEGEPLETSYGVDLYRRMFGADEKKLNDTEAGADF